MANQNTFSSEEWTLLRLTPSLVSAGMAAADPSGIFATIKEGSAGAQGVAEALRANSDLELFAALAADRSIPAMPAPQTMLGDGTHEEKMRNFKAAILDRVKTAAELVARKGSAAEAGAYRKMLVEVADRTANASKEGGFLGFGGVRVSDKEQAFISEVGRAAGLS